MVNLVALHRPHRLAVKEAAPAGGEGFLLAGIEVEVNEFAVVARSVAQGDEQHPLAPLDEVSVQHFAVDLHGGTVAQRGDGGDVRAVFVAQRQVGEEIAQGFNAAAGEEREGFFAVGGEVGQGLVEGHGCGGSAMLGSERMPIEDLL